MVRIGWCKQWGSIRIRSRVQITRDGISGQERMGIALDGKEESGEERRQ